MLLPFPLQCIIVLLLLTLFALYPLFAEWVFFFLCTIDDIFPICCRFFFSIITTDLKHFQFFIHSNFFEVRVFFFSKLCFTLVACKFWWFRCLLFTLFLMSLAIGYKAFASYFSLLIFQLVFLNLLVVFWNVKQPNETIAH